MDSKLAWGIIGTGSIAKTFAKGLARSKTGRLAAVGSRTRNSADQFGHELGVPEGRRHAGYDALLADPDVQAVYISTPHPMHAEWAIKAAEAGKHILCEKPIGLNAYEAMAIIEAARDNHVFLMEAFMYRCHPQTARLVELIRDRAIGEVRMTQAAFGFHWPKPLNTTSRLTSNALGGGGILDVGCYPVSLARLVAGVAQAKPFAEPIEVKAVGHVGPLSRCDEYTAAVLAFPGDLIAQVSTGVQLAQENVARIYGTDGNLFIPSPWIPGREGGATKIVLTRYDGSPVEEIEIKTDDWLYALEADTVGEAVAAGHLEAAWPAMSWDDTLGNMKTLDEWRRQIGMLYDAEKPESQTRTIGGRPLVLGGRSKGVPQMIYGRIPGVDKPVSRLVIGVDNQTFMSHASIVLDDFFEKGGNAFDTAHIYGPEHEGNLGHWIKNRGVREQVVILDKGAHTPNCNPEALLRQHRESLDRLQTDYVDLYMLHRDNPQVPVGEFIDVLNGLKSEGSIRTFGGSNWSIPRVEEADTYARSKGLTGFVVLSNQFSLARMVDPVWTGCISASDPQSRAWLEETQTVLMPWSSQARGFFTERGVGSEPEMKRCWQSEDNFRRRQRALELADQRGVEPINIALAYVLHQSFPTFPLIGPRTLGETRSSLRGLAIQLTPEEIRWLNLEA